MQTPRESLKLASQSDVSPLSSNLVVMRRQPFRYSEGKDRRLIPVSLYDVLSAEDGWYSIKERARQAVASGHRLIIEVHADEPVQIRKV